MDCSDIYWPPWLHIYQQVQASRRTGTAGVEQELKKAQRWLQEGAACFKSPSEQAAAALRKGGSLKASAYGPGKGFVIDKQLVQATVELSQLLVRQHHSQASLSHVLLFGLVLCSCANQHMCMYVGLLQSLLFAVRAIHPKGAHP